MPVIAVEFQVKFLQPDLLQIAQVCRWAGLWQLQAVWTKEASGNYFPITAESFGGKGFEFGVFVCARPAVVAWIF